VKRSSTLLATLTCLVLAAGAFAERVPPGTVDDIRARLTPFGSVCVVGAECAGAVVADTTDAGGAARSGEQVYNTFCFACHATGVSGAPKFGSVEDWAPRLDKGMDALWQTSIDGLGAMPPMGTCMDCSEAEMRATIDYMSGG
jgi:cytochrome c5